MEHTPPPGASHDTPPVALDFGALPSVEARGPWSAEWWLAVSNLRGGSSEAFVSLITVLSIVGVVLGVAVLDCVLAVMNGFEIDLRDKILGANAHIVVMQYGGGMTVDEEMLATIEGIEGVQHAAPFVYSELMLRSRFGSSGIVLKGIDPERTGDVTQVRNQLQLGIQGELTTADAKREVFEAMAGGFAGGGLDGDELLPGILIGDALAEEIQAVPGDKVQLLNPLGGGTGLLGMPTPTARSVRVAGIFHSGMYEYDTKWSYVSVAEAQSFLKLDDKVTGVEIRVDEIDEVEDIARRVEEAVGYPHYARHWRNLNQALFEALELEKIVMSLILGMVIVVAGLLIISNLDMLVLTKRREIAILKAMGASGGTILRIFVATGGVIGLVGTTVGSALGYAGCRFLTWYKWPLETDVYYLSSLPVSIVPLNFVVVALVALSICVVSTLYPAFRAATLDPVEGLRYE